ncbi:MAG: Fic family protein [Bacteroidia bacterium]
MWIYFRKEWPRFEWDNDRVVPLLVAVRHLQGRILGRMNYIGFELKDQANLEMVSLDVLKSTEIEGELLDPEQVRSSVARRLGLDMPGLVPSDRNVDGVVDLMLDATRNYAQPLTEERLFAWHNSLFPTGRSGLYKILVGTWRDDSTGPMQVVSGGMGYEKVHFQAPDAKFLPAEMTRFLAWFNAEQTMDTVLKAGMAQLWFLTLHPFEDGNGRIARALTDMLLARSDGQPYRYYSMSTQVRLVRNDYYDILERSQRNGMDITKWMMWFLECLKAALEASDEILSKVLFRHEFWLRNATRLDNERQRKILAMMLDHFEGKLNTSKWAKISKCSQDTAMRDIQDLIDKGILYKLPSGGRSTSYELERRQYLPPIG